MLDATNISGKNFAAMKTYIKATLDHFEINEAACRIGLIYFADYAFSHSYLISHNNREDVYKALDEIPLRLGSSNYYTALWLLYSDTFMVKRGGRDDAPNVAVLITDNPPSESVISKLGNSMRTVADTIRESGTQIISIAIGDEVPKTLLETISGSPTQVVSVPDYDALSQNENIQHLVFRIKERGNHLIILIFPTINILC